MAKRATPELSSPQLRELMNQVQEVDATIRRCQGQRRQLLEKVMAEAKRLRSEEDRALAGLEANVIVRWDEGMTARDIANALHRPVRLIERVIATYRERHGVRIRRGASVPERRKLR